MGKEGSAVRARGCEVMFVRRTGGVVVALLRGYASVSMRCRLSCGVCTPTNTLYGSGQGTHLRLF